MIHGVFLKGGFMKRLDGRDISQLRDAIRRERRVELAQEFHRYFDLMRWGKAYAEAALGVDFNYDTKRYQPIPQAELDRNQALKP